MEGGREKGAMGLTLSMFVAVLILGFVGQTLIKAGLNSAHRASPDGARWFGEMYLAPGVIAGTFVVGLGFLCWVAVLSRLDLSQAMPLLAISYVPWLFIARFVLHEKVTLAQWMGVLLISAGVYLALRK